MTELITEIFGKEFLNDIARNTSNQKKYSAPLHTFFGKTPGGREQIVTT